ncbi:tetratricopeptide repeat protein [Salinibacter ruber]|uniref:tetratricopeptide repeat protein n=1 Tax=Salinibacter ruber TaxID=146919 RepID=UPI00216A5CB4|nr:tetratricopeptide (TPR) repeat protein [Salinibacter ruber]
MDGSLISDLIRRRVPQVLAGYLGVTWTLFELMQWLTEQYLISPHLGRAILFGLLMLLPAVVLVTYRHGRPGPDRWTSTERWTIAGNGAVAVFVLVIVFGDVELGSMVRTVETSAADTSGVNPPREVIRRVPKKQFRRRVALFYFDEAESARADTALRRGAPTALRTDLEQDPFVSTLPPVRFDGDLQRRGYEEGLDVPLGLKREVAQETNAGYVLAGRVGTTGTGQTVLSTQLRETETGDLVAERRFEGDDLFAIIDRASAQLKQDLDLPDGHLESTTDLPVTQVFTSSVEAAKHYAQGRHLRRFTDTTDRSVAREYGRATSADTTFALGHFREGQALWRLGKRERARQALGSARRHSYRLSESWKYELKALRFFRLEGRPEAALKVCERWTSLRPYDLDGWRLKASIHARQLQHEQALSSYRRMLALAPGSDDAKRGIVGALLRTGQREKALRKAKSYEEANPEDESGPLLVGTIRWRLGRPERAERAYRRAERMDARDARAYLSALNQARGQFEAALSGIKEEASEGEERFQAGIRLSHHHWLRGRIGRSRTVLDSLWTAGPPAPGGYQRFRLAVRACDYHGPIGRRSYISKLLGRLEALKQDVSTSARAYEINARAALARCNVAAGRLTEAQRHLEHVKTLVERSGTPQLYRLPFDLDYLWGRLREAQGRHEDAAARYEQYVEDSFPRSLLFRTLRLPRLRLALTYQKAGRPGEARAAYQGALALYPAYPRLNYRCAQFLADRGRREAARTHLRRALKGWAPADADFRPKQRAEALADSLGLGVV